MASFSSKLPPLHLFRPFHSYNSNPNPKPRLLASSLNATSSSTRRIRKQRYPSEKKKLEKKQKALTIAPKDEEESKEGFWRLSKLKIPARKDPGKDFVGISLPLLHAIAKVLDFPVASMLPEEAFTVVRKSFDARKSDNKMDFLRQIFKYLKSHKPHGFLNDVIFRPRVLKEPEFVYIVDMDVKKILSLEPRTWEFVSQLEAKFGLVEYMPVGKVSPDLVNLIHNIKSSGSEMDPKKDTSANRANVSNGTLKPKRPKVAIVGSGPSGLFASLVLAEFGAEVTLIERGQPVERRGRDIGALVVRRILHSESNFCFGEGGAGTWSDGKLVTRIGRNSDCVHSVMNTFIRFGAPTNILIDGKPHLGTDRLVPLLRNFRRHLQELGVDIKFGTRLDDLIVENGRVTGIKICGSGQTEPDYQKVSCDAVVLAVGHSARDVYTMLLQHDVEMAPKDFSVGLRIEHPQELINRIQYPSAYSEVHNGRGKVPVADYKLVKYISDGEGERDPDQVDRQRSCYSFCMCPGGQVVTTSTNPLELCINGMSFSKRASRWANAALAVTLSKNDLEPFQSHSPLAGVEFQREYERKAATMGGGNFVVPAQTVTDFLDNRLTVTSLPPSSYRLGVRPSNLHELFPHQITQALQRSILKFNEEMPGFVSKDALLHGVETRTSSPIQISRQGSTYESKSHKGLYPIGEGAGYAGGIVSAAVDGLHCGFALAKELNLYQGNVEATLGVAPKNSGFVKY